MTIQDDAERLRALASSDTLPIGIMSQAENQLLDLNAQVMAILNPNTQHATNILGLANAAAESISAARAALQAVESAIHDAADHYSS
ncbi:hypothetical protein ACIOD2_32485 [Amycolatopsis sp. NPDC088138]|uniref:hypothetical protein n=1 Tax=Amycolatopsis sp. NPDC088138 TaxID=3363938 RepID=UPI0038240415